MHSQRLPRLLLALLAFVSLATPLFAEPLPKSIVVAYPADGVAANSTSKEASQFSLIDQGSVGGAYLSASNFTLTYPNGTSAYIGAVTSGGCMTSECSNLIRVLRGTRERKASSLANPPLLQLARAIQLGATPGPSTTRKSATTCVGFISHH